MGDIADGCSIIDTMATVCVGTPPLPATGVDLWHYFPGLVILWTVGWGLVWMVRRDN